MRGLQETNEEIGNAFMKLHDYVLTHGILDVAPDFAHQLHSTTENILSLVGRLDDDDDDDDNGNEDSAAPQASSSQNQIEKSPFPETIDTTAQSGPVIRTPVVLGYNLETGYDVLPPFSTTGILTILTASTPPSTQTAVYCSDTNMPVEKASFSLTRTDDSILFPNDVASFTPPLPQFIPPSP